MKTWESAEPLIATAVLAAPWPIVEQALLTAAREFFSKSTAWRQVLDAQPSVADVAEYDTTDDRSAECVKILAATYDGSALTPAPATVFATEKARLPGSGLPRYITFMGSSLVLCPAPSVDGRLIVVEAALRPTLTAKGLPDEVFSEHIEAIVEGAKARIMSAKDEPFSDKGGADRAATEFRRAIATASIVAAKGGTRARLRSRPVYL